MPTKANNNLQVLALGLSMFFLLSEAARACCPPKGGGEKTASGGTGKATSNPKEGDKTADKTPAAGLDKCSCTKEIIIAADKGGPYGVPPKPIHSPPLGRSSPDPIKTDPFATGSRSVTAGIGPTRDAALRSNTFSRNSAAIAAYERQVASSIADDHGRASEYARPLLDSPSPQDQARGREFLSRSVSPPEEHAKIYQELGLHTNKDLLEKGPEYVENLSKAAPENEKQAEKWAEEAKKAEKAASQMEEFNKTLENRSAKIASVEDQSLLRAKPAKGTLSNGELSSRDGANQALGLADSGMLKTASGAEGGAKDKAGKEALAAGGTGGAGDQAAGGGRNPASLRASLRETLALGKGKKGGAGDGESADEPKSAFDSIFQKSDADKTASAAGKEGKDGKDGKDGKATDPAFAMSGAETDVEVKRIMNEMGADQQGSGEQIFGNIDQTIFARMSSYLTKAQLQNKIVVR